ncbi:hypothetical protein Q7P37_006459 [Cladosporium fusiforme]
MSVVADPGNKYSDIRASGESRTHLGNRYTYITNNYPERNAQQQAPKVKVARGRGLRKQEKREQEQREQEKRERIERQWRAALVGWLTFAEINDRREQVNKAHKDTYKWIFERGNTTGFTEWLRTGDGIFWISGKPASGKSTLMKFIMHEDRLRRFLQTWTGNTPLVIASFWFWAGGTPLQRSLVGLYRTFLLQVLRTDDRLCRTAFPDWEVKFRTTDPSIEMLTTAMNNILSKGEMPANFFFIIDGLDEYDRDSIGKGELVELMWMMTRSSRVKLLLSSRLETEFHNGFRSCPSIRLEDLTEPDIRNYIQARLWNNPFVRTITKTEKVDIKDIEAFMRENARGVFLWVKLVMAMTLDGINNYEDVAIIRGRIMDLPVELNELFTHILTKRIPKCYKPAVFRYLVTALSWESIESSLRTPLHGVILAIAHEALSKGNAGSIVSSSQSQIRAATANLRNRLKSQCHGLLECTGEQEDLMVTFMHRTLLDYLQQEESAKSLLLSEVGTDFEVYTAIMAGIACFRKWLLHSGSAGQLDRSKYVSAFFRFSSLAEDATCNHTIELATHLNRIMVRDFRNISIQSEEFENLKQNSAYHHFGPNRDPKMLLLGYSINTGGTLYLRESILEGVHFDADELTSLLLFTVTKKKQIQTTAPASLHWSRFSLVRAWGGSPGFGCVWGRCLILHVLTHMARRISDRQNSTKDRLDLQGHLDVNPSQHIRRCVLERECCHGASLADCGCPDAPKLQGATLELLKLLDTLAPVNEPMAIPVQDPTSPAQPRPKIFRKLNLKRLFSRPHQHPVRPTTPAARRDRRRLSGRFEGVERRDTPALDGSLKPEIGFRCTRQGHSPNVKFPCILGIEATGLVEDAPNGEFQKGDVVATAMGEMGRAFDGGYLKKGETLLIRGGTTSIGLAASALAVNHGARVVSTSRGETRSQLLKDRGASIVIIDNGSIAEEVKAQTGGGVNKVLEFIGTATLLDSLQCVKPHGIVCMTGIAGNSWILPEFAPMGSIPTSVCLTSYAGGPDEFMRTPLQDLARQIEEGNLKVSAAKTFRLEEIVDAHRMMEQNRAGGKIVVLP